MAGLIRKIVRTGVIGGVVAGVAVGGTILIAGHERATAIFHQIHEEVIETIDQNLTDPVAMRTQLRELQQQYPERISQVRGDLAQLNEQIGQLEREKTVSQRVVALAARDLEALAPLISAASGDSSGVSLVAIRYGDDSAAKRAESRARQIRQTQVVYSNRATEAQHDLGYMRQQGVRMEEVLGKLETEYSQFQAQLWQLERQVDAIARNENLIELLAERQQAIDEMSRFEVASLDHLVSRLAEMRSRQEAELELLAADQRRVDYESVARIEIDEEARTQTETLLEMDRYEGELSRVDER
jgi:hypothetical protein